MERGFGKPDDSDSAKIAQRDIDIKNGLKIKDVVRSVSNYEDEIKNGDCGCAHHVKKFPPKWYLLALYGW